MRRCEDFPCCGHTYDDPCYQTEYNPYDDPHVLCDHELGFCDIEDDGEPEVESMEDWGEVELDRRSDAFDNSRY